jgi:hypothetical protein
MSKSVTALLAAAALVVLAVVLNPSAEKHRATINKAIAERSQVEKVLGVGQLTAFVSKYHSVGVGSYTTVNDKVTSVGALGMVFVAD